MSDSFVISVENVGIGCKGRNEFIYHLRFWIYLKTFLRATVRKYRAFDARNLKKIFRLFSDYKKLLSIEEIWCTFSSGAPKFWENWEKRIWPAKIPKDPASKCEIDISNWLSVFKEKRFKGSWHRTVIEWVPYFHRNYMTYLYYS